MWWWIVEEGRWILLCIRSGCRKGTWRSFTKPQVQDTTLMTHSSWLTFCSELLFPVKKKMVCYSEMSSFLRIWDHLFLSILSAGGPYGSIGIDYEFEKLLCKIFGQDFIDQFKIKRPAAWVDLMIAFESRKRAATPDRSNPLNINLPFSFIDYYKKFRGHSVEHALRKSKWVSKTSHVNTVQSSCTYPWLFASNWCFCHFVVLLEKCMIFLLE